MLTASLFSALLMQNPGHRYPLQCHHHLADDVQHVRVPGGTSVSAAGEVSSAAHLVCCLPHTQHLPSLLAHGVFNALAHSENGEILFWLSSLMIVVCVYISACDAHSGHMDIVSKDDSLDQQLSSFYNVRPINYC